MKTTMVRIEGEKGSATIQRTTVEGKTLISIDGAGAGGLISWLLDPDYTAAKFYDFAARLQRELDGYRGTYGDVNDCLRAIQNFAD